MSDDQRRVEIVDASRVCAILAACLTEGPSTNDTLGSAGERATDPAPPPWITLGSVILTPEQTDAVHRVGAALRGFGGALLADDVGTGKTFVALATATHYDDACIIAPAALLPMWRQAIERVGLESCTVRSLQAFSRAGGDARAASGRRTLIVIDEAHHLRTRSTRRYRRVTAFAAGCDLLLLSATPLHNRAGELRALLALFAGNRSDLLDDETLARMIVRRVSTDLRTDAMHTPQVAQHPPWPVPDDPATIRAIMALPPPLPARDGSPAPSLMRAGLLRALCSSDAALAAALRARRLRGEALRTALEDGRHPTRSELRAWVLGDDAVQLGFAPLLSAQLVEPPSIAALRPALSAHLDALGELAAHHTATACADGERVRLLRTLMREHDGVPVIAFSQYTATVRALYTRLRSAGGVAMLTGSRAEIASGPVSRAEVLARFSARAQGRAAPAAHQVVRMLLATDILAEGVNLQDAGLVVHVDLPWTDALLRQRVGRVARIGAAFPVVHVHALGPPARAAHALRLLDHLARKAVANVRLVGRPANASLVATGGSVRVASRASPARSAPATHVDDTAHDVADDPDDDGADGSAAECASRLRARLRCWGADVAAEVSLPRTVLVGCVHASHVGWLALVGRGDEYRLLASACEPMQPGAVPRFDDALRTVLRCVEAVELSGAAERPRPAEPRWRADIPLAIAGVHRWCDARLLADAVGPTRPSWSPVQTRAMQGIAAALATMPPLRRSAAHDAARRARRLVERARGLSSEQALEAWLAASEHLSSERWLSACPEPPVARRRATDTCEGDPSAPHQATAPPFVLHALLRLEPRRP